MVTVICAECGMSFETFPCHVRRGKGAGTKCRQCRSNRGRVELPCIACGANLRIKRSVFQNSKNKRFYCNSVCLSIGLSRLSWPKLKPRDAVPCDICGKLVDVPPCKSRSYKHHFCGDDCRFTWIRRSGHGKGEKSGKWKGGRTTVYCATCGKPKRIPGASARAYKMHFCDQAQCLAAWRSDNKRGPSNPNWHGGGATDPVLRRLNSRMAAGMRDTLCGGKRRTSWQHLIGYTVWDLQKRLNRTMPSGYSWDDFTAGRLHIDHMIPITAFNFRSSDDLDFKRCWALDNLQLLPAEANLRKGAKLSAPHQPGLAFGLAN